LLPRPDRGVDIGSIVVDFDQSLEGQAGLAKRVEEVVGHVYAEPQFFTKNQERGAIDTRSLQGRSCKAAVVTGRPVGRTPILLRRRVLVLQRPVKPVLCSLAKNTS